MTTIPHLAATVHPILTEQADLAGRRTRLIQRPTRSTFTGSTFVQTLVFGWLADPDASRDALAQTAAAAGVTMTPQGLDQRFTAAAADGLRAVLAAGGDAAIGGAAVATPLIQRFTEVRIIDGATITVPDALADPWPGCGGRTPHPTAAARTISVGLDLRAGALQGPFRESARPHENGTTVAAQPAPPGSVRLGEAGCFNLERFAALDAAAAYWLTRLRGGTTILTTDGVPVDRPAWRAPQGPQGDQAVLVGQGQRLSARLLALRVPQEVADQRRRRAQAAARRSGPTARAAPRARMDGTILLTNAPRALLRLAEALALARARWQIELLFKLWQSHGKGTPWRSAKPGRIRCAVDAKLLAMLIHHWVMVVRCGKNPDRSLPTAARTVRA
ncbi:MAG: IS4 family transposase [Anaerolineales bacterium]|nr:IS4 family transposase [Anaerolineales bacterium]